MIDYELTCIFNPDLKDKKKLLEKIEGWMKKAGAKVKKKDEWDKKELAYRIQKFSEGIYVFWQLEAEPSKISDLFSKIKLEKDIIRYLLVKTV